ncbi:copper transporter [Nonomuraea rhodomycinica]|uniref:Copper transporter n=1 Tax=Nonomuraea rhodomycinica TaxID=1712872 RepID=A0A7Y6MCJ8_9ACTN|nr:copper transporter [Nonomuraea rhodomycinica]NUW41599.1 copper transporter [Nonomuraea rhodomycinica]
MIDFRYHLVSIVAIFLALAVGIVMGTTLLQSPAIETAKKTSDLMAKTNNDLRSELDALRGREAADDAFVTAFTPRLVAGELNGERVLLVEAPGSSTTYREAQQQVLLQAGAAITGRVTLSDKFLDPKNQGVIDGLVTQLKPDDMALAPSTNAYDKAATLLAATLLTTDQAQAGTANPATAAVLGGFEAGGLLTVDDEPAKRATLVVMFAPERPLDGENAESQAAALLSLARGLDAAGKGTVIAGSVTAASAGGLITAARDESDLVKRVSTVDTVDMPAGRTAIVYALREQLNGRAGQYGIGANATAPMPAVPNPTTTPTSSGS